MKNSRPGPLAYRFSAIALLVTAANLMALGDLPGENSMDSKRA